jgi:predicted acetyltransferase
VQISLQNASIDNGPVLRNLMQLYLYDFSEFSGEDVSSHGLYGYAYLDFYWVEQGRHAYLIRADDRLAGFVLVRELLSGENQNERIYSIAEFFVMRKYRRIGIGRDAARQVFSLFPGVWRVGEMHENQPAQVFWRKVIGEFTGGHYREIAAPDWDGPMQEFRSAK